MRIVVLRALKLGDFLTAVPAFRALRRAYPASRISLAAPAAFAALADLLDGAIDELIDVREGAALPAVLAGADLGINLHGSGPQSHRLLAAARPQRTIAFCNADAGGPPGAPAWDPEQHEVERWCALLRHAGIPADPGALDLRVPPIAVPRRARGATIVHPGASSESRRWPIARWAAVARAQQAAGRRVVITGGAQEIELAHAVARDAGVPATHVYAGRTNLRELAAIVACAERVVCGDTGIAHLATAYRRPSVVLFGPTPPQRWGPPPRPYHRVLWNGTSGDPHADRLDRGLAAIAAEHVIAALATLPAASTARTSRATA